MKACFKSLYNTASLNLWLCCRVAGSGATCAEHLPAYFLGGGEIRSQRRPMQFLQEAGEATIDSRWSMKWCRSFMPLLGRAGCHSADCWYNVEPGLLSPGRSHTMGLHANVAVLTLYGDRGCSCMVVNESHAWW